MNKFLLRNRLYNIYLMKSQAILRIALGITFFWIGVLIFRHPGEWANFLSDWFVKLLPVSSSAFMSGISFLDMGLGLLLILNRFTKWVALIAAVHLLGILVSSGITDVTIRDVGLLGASIALFLDERK